MAGVALLAGCGGGTTAPGTETAYDFAFPDPAADTVVATANPSDAKALDLLNVSGHVDANNVTVTLEFAEPVSPWSDGRLDALDGFLDFDLDQSTSTGSRDDTHDIGIDAYVDLRDDGSGRLALVNLSTRKIDLLDGKWSGTTFEVTIPRKLLVRASDTDNKMFLAVDVTARGRKPNTDSAPDTGHLILTPPVTP
jgi:hypothetical protein